MGEIMTSNPALEKAPAAPTFEHDEESECAELSARLGARIEARFGPRGETPLAILARDETGALIGGVNGVTHWRWLYVRHLWVEEGRRGQGLGRELMARAEAAAKARGAVGVYLDTFDESAAAFYESCGFARFGRIEDFPPGHGRIFLCKRMEQ
jgi:GNAT superfamily N-acetyltransferase